MLRIGKRMLSWHSTKFKMAGVSSEKITSIDMGEKITDELVYGNRRDGTSHGATAGLWEPDNIALKMLADEWYGTDALRTGYLGLLTLGKTVGLADTEFDLQLQFFEEFGVASPSGPATVTIIAPVARIVGVKLAAAKGVAGQEVDLNLRVIEPVRGNGAQLASLVRSFSAGAGF